VETFTTYDIINQCGERTDPLDIVLDPYRLTKTAPALTAPSLFHCFKSTQTRRISVLLCLERMQS
jgi:hypothetical protein